MNCDEADLLLAAAAVGDLQDADVEGLRAHLEGCARCRTAGARYAETAGVLPLALRTVEPPPDLRSQIMSRVHAEAAAHPPGRTRARGGLRELWNRLPTSRGLTLGAAAVAVACAVLAAVALSTASHQAAPSPGAAVLRVDVAGTTTQPSAHGTLIYHPAERQAVLTLQGLADPLPAAGLPARTYEVWLVRPNGAAVPAAFLTLGPDRRTWTASIAGDMSGYAYLAATIEPWNGSQTPTGAEVVHADLPPPVGSSPLTRTSAPA